MRESNKLDALTVSRLKEPGRYSDGHGLWLQVSSSGTKAWLFRYMLNGRARHIGLGSVRTFSLKEARDRARQARQLIADGKDPSEAKRSSRAAHRSADSMLFKEAARRFIELYESEWKSSRHRQQWRNTLRDYVHSTLGNRPICAIDGALITETLAPIWTAKPETAKRVKQRIERVVQWVRDGMPLPMQGASKRVQHHPAMPFTELPSFMEELRKLDEIKARALEFTILTAARTSEVLKATWVEIDLDAKVWTTS